MTTETENTHDQATNGGAVSELSSSDLLGPVGVWLIDEAEYWCARAELEAVEAYKKSYRLRITDDIKSEPAEDHMYAHEDEVGFNWTMEEAVKVKLRKKKPPFLVAVSTNVL